MPTPMTVTRSLAMLVALCAASPGFFGSAIAAPDEELLGKSKGYPAGTRANWYTDDAVRVGSYTNLDKLFQNQYHVLHKAENPSPLGKVTAEPALQYRFGGRLNTIDDYLARQRVTGLLVIKDDHILVERYQYDRKPTDRLTSNSMAKSLVSIGIGFALSDKLIHSLDDRVVEYVPELKGNIYGETKIRNLLRMASGARFTEDSVSRNDDADKFARLHGSKGSIASGRLIHAKHPKASAFITRRSRRRCSRELVEAVRRNVTIDWAVKETARAKLRVMVRRILRKHGYPPDKQDKATQTVLEQAELLGREVAA
jgi:hypothetical protein